MNQLGGDGQDVRKAIETLRASANDLREQSRKDDDPRASRLMLDMANEVDGVADELEDSFCPDDHETFADHDQPPVDGRMGVTASE